MGDCRDTRNDADNCGSCDYKCSEHPIGVATSNSCQNSVCQYSCPVGYDNCGGSTAGSVNCISHSAMDYDNYHCGSCTKTCNSDESCVAGVCQANTCSNGQALCGMGDCRTINGNDANNCGGCDYKCSDHSVGSATSNSCQNGVCQYGCHVSGEQNCGGSTESTVMCISNESMLSDKYHCGSCDNVCGSAESCIDGNCVTTGCPSTQLLCPEEGGNNCRTLSSDAANCGYCGYRCADLAGWTSSASCNNGNCVATQCQSGYCVSNSKCFDGRSSVYTCGINGSACANCTTTPNSTSTYCDNGVCKVVACKANFHISSNGKACEADTNTVCGNARVNCTSIPHSTSTSCVSGACVVNSCEEGYHVSGTQCVQDSNSYCGTSGLNCNSKDILYKLNATAAYCQSGECIPSSCIEGYSLTSDGQACKKDTNTSCGSSGINCSTLWPNADLSYCKDGQCVKKCSDGYVMDSDGNCVPKGNLVCPTGLTNCNGAGVCIDLTSDSNNCGGCGHQCKTGTSCSNGRCVCGSGKTNCGSEDSPVCVSSSFTQTDHCGYCNNSCNSIKPLHSTVKDCSDSHCHFKCSSGYANAGTGDTVDTILCVQTGTDACCYSVSGMCQKCTNGKVCDGSTCVSPGTVCNPGQTLCGGTCVNVSSSNEHCGMCNNACGKHSSCENASCVCDKDYIKCDGMSECVIESSLDNNTSNCGACGNDCASTELYPGFVKPMCKNGVCQAESCKDDFCMDLSNGSQVCVNGLNNPEKCGKSGECKKCPSVEHGTGYCDNGSCSIYCETGYFYNGTKCELAYSGCDQGELFCNGACVPNNSSNCGSCGNVCGTGTQCTSGHCVCTTSGYTNCGTDASPNCVNLNSTTNNCGACGHVCGTGTKCSSGQCVCKTSGQTNCGTDASPNCVNLNSNNSYCGSCTHQCATGLSCSSGQCICKTTGQTNCGTDSAPNCVDTSGDINNCGACGYQCDKHVPGWDKGVCENGNCVPTLCQKNYCLDENICYDGLNNNKHCGVSGACKDCTGEIENGVGYCNQGTCDIICNTGYSLVNGKCVKDTTSCGDGYTLCNGQCKNLQTDSSHCGACNHVCGSGTSCSTGHCECTTSGTTNCGTDASPNCVNLNEDTKYCGSCVNNCNDTTLYPGWQKTYCKSGECKTDTGCSEASTCFDSANSVCVNGLSDVNKCGANGNECKPCTYTGEGGTAYCNLGKCSIACDPGWVLNDAGDKCVKVVSSCPGNQLLCGGSCIDQSINNCGYCNYKCSEHVPGWKTGTCDAGVCNASQCSSGYCLDNGSCYDNKTDDSHCGADCLDCTKLYENGTGICSEGTCEFHKCDDGGYVYDSFNERCFMTYTNLLGNAKSTPASPVMPSKICDTYKDSANINFTSGTKVYAFNLDSALNVSAEDETNAQIVFSISKTNGVISVGGTSNTMLYDAEFAASYTDLTKPGSPFHSFSCPTKDEEYRLTSITLPTATNVCSKGAPVICAKTKEGIYKLIAIYDNNNAIIYWLPQK